MKIKHCLTLVDAEFILSHAFDYAQTHELRGGPTCLNN